jgi:hypothetical protein
MGNSQPDPRRSGVEAVVMRKAGGFGAVVIALGPALRARAL